VDVVLRYICLLFTKCHILFIVTAKILRFRRGIIFRRYRSESTQIRRTFHREGYAFQPFLVFKAHDKIRSRSPITTCNRFRVELQRSALSREWYTYAMLE